MPGCGRDAEDVEQISRLLGDPLCIFCHSQICIILTVRRVFGVLKISFKSLKNRCPCKSSVIYKSLLLKMEDLPCLIKSAFWQVHIKTWATERTDKKPWELSPFKIGVIKQNFKVEEW